MRDAYTGDERISLRCSQEMKNMLIAVGQYEHRSESQVIRLALAEYFTAKGYLTTTGDNNA